MHREFLFFPFLEYNPKNGKQTEPQIVQNIDYQLFMNVALFLRIEKYALYPSS